MIKGPQASWKIIFLFVVLSVFVVLAAASHDVPSEVDPSSWTSAQLKRYLDDHNIDYKSQHPLEHSDYVKLVNDYRHSIKGAADSAAEWFRKQKDSAASQLQSAEEVTTSFVDRVKANLLAKKILTEAQLNALMIDLRGQVTSIKDWGAIKEAQSQKVYDDIKTSLDKQATLKKADMDVVLQNIKKEFESTVKDYTSSASKLAASAQSTGNDAYHYVTSKVADAYKSAASVVSEKIYNGASSASDKASSTASGASSAASSAASNAASSVSSAASAASSAASSAANAAYNSAGSAYSSATSAAGEAASNAYESANEYYDSVLNSIRARLVSAKGWSEDQVNGVITYLKGSLHKGRVTTEKQVNSVVDGVNEYLVEKKELSKDQVASVVKSVREELEKWRLNQPAVKKEEL
jgi:hypothetical protein